MKKETFDRIVDNNPLYKKFFATSFKDMSLMTYVEPTRWRGKDSEHSLSFKNDDVIKELFGVEVNDLSNRLDKRFRTIHSSALLALLFFYGIKKNPLSIKDPDVEYTQVFFEVKNKVFDNPSSIDVLLADKDGHNLLFLESKFTEYLSYGKRGNIDIKYKEYYEQLNDFWNDQEVGVQWVEEDDNTLCIKGKEEGRTRHYCEGVKQMISHYIGLLRGPQDEDGDYKKLFDSSKQLILGEIVYNFGDFGKARFDNYSKLYRNLASCLKKKDVYNSFVKDLKCQDSKKVMVLNDILTYQNIINAEDNATYKANLRSEIKKFYHLE